MKKLAIWYLKRIVKDLDFQEASLEMGADGISGVNEKWQRTRSYKECIKKTITYLS